VNLRLRRLAADYERMRLTFLDGGTIRIRDVEGDPPEVYRLTYAVKGLIRHAGDVRAKSGFDVEIRLPLDYPRVPPQCRMLTPIFHPNIAPHAICIGDHWAGGESLVRLTMRIAEMIGYQSYNLKSPLNGEAARWTEENLPKLPIDRTDFALRDVAAGGADGMVKVCQNCGSQKELRPCASGHPACADCRADCGCGASICMACAIAPCAECQAPTCPACGRPCGNCSKQVCGKHAARCAACERPACAECAATCPACRSPLCLTHAAACPKCGPAPEAKPEPEPERPVLACPQCRKRFRVPDGKTARCPMCKVPLG
jgi:ubiquitin-protein ligase